MTDPADVAPILREQTAAIVKLAELLDRVAADVAHTSHELTGATQEFGKLHGELQALEHEEAQERRRMHADIRLVLESVRGIGTRLATVESKVAGIELHMHERSNGNGTT